MDFVQISRSIDASPVSYSKQAQTIDAKEGAAQVCAVVILKTLNDGNFVSKTELSESITCNSDKGNNFKRS